MSLHSPDTVAASAPASDLLKLSVHDVERLLTEETPDVRIDVLGKVAKGHNERHYSLNELHVAEQIFRVLIKDTEVSVRETLALVLKDNPQIPRDIVISLLDDVDSVALPMIESSAVLTEDDLISLVKSANQPMRAVAVARRSDVTEVVSNVLLETHNHSEEVIATLVQNQRAKIPVEAYENILRNHGKNSAVMDAVAVRPNLPVTLVERVISLASDSIASSLRQRGGAAPAAIMAETEKTREIATLKLVDGKLGQRDVEKLVDQLQAFGRLTPSIILTSLCRGNLYFFETSLARLSNIPVRNAQLLIHDKGGLGFKALYGKAGLPDKFFAPCRLLLEVVAELQRLPEHSDSYADDVVQRLLAKAGGQNVENLAYIIALIRQNA